MNRGKPRPVQLHGTPYLESVCCSRRRHKQAAGSLLGDGVLFVVFFFFVVVVLFLIIVRLYLYPYIGELVILRELGASQLTAAVKKQLTPEHIERNILQRRFKQQS